MILALALRNFMAFSSTTHLSALLEMPYTPSVGTLICTLAFTVSQIQLTQFKGFFHTWLISANDFLAGTTMFFFVLAHKKESPFQSSRLALHTIIETHGKLMHVTARHTLGVLGFTPNWTEEIFVIDEVLNTNHVTYRLVDLLGEPIKGSFYEQEIQKTTQDVFRIEKVIRRDNKRKLALCKMDRLP